MTSRNTAPPKRSRSLASDVDDDNSSGPPLSKRVTRSRPSATDAQASDRIQDDARDSQADEWNTPYDFEDAILHSDFLKSIKLFRRELAVPFERYLLDKLSFEIKRGRPDRIEESVQAIDDWFASYPHTDSASERNSFTWMQQEWQ
ncbi:hypothetical protein FRB90_004796, partial [Tulasnella sp. 427]